MNESYKNFEFEGKREGEEILHIAHSHPWTVAKPMLIILILAIAPVISFILAGASWITAWVIFGFLAIALPYAVNAWFVWWNNIYILTDQRLIDIDQLSMFHRRISEAPLEMIQDIHFETRGPIGTILNFGTVEVQTASDRPAIKLENIENPYDIQQKILQQADKKRPHLA